MVTDVINFLINDFEKRSFLIPYKPYKCSFCIYVISDDKLYFLVNVLDGYCKYTAFIIEIGEEFGFEYARYYIGRMNITKSIGYNYVGSIVTVDLRKLINDRGMKNLLTYLVNYVISDIMKEGCYYIHPFFISYPETEMPKLYKCFREEGMTCKTLRIIFSFTELYNYITNIDIIPSDEFSKKFNSLFNEFLRKYLTRGNLRNFIRFLILCLIK